LTGLMLVFAVLVGLLIVFVLVIGGNLGNLFDGLFGGSDPVVTSTNTMLTLVERRAVLSTVRYNFEKPIPVTVSQDVFGESLIYLGVGYVTAGVDISGLTEDDIIVDDSGRVTMVLPPAFLSDCVLDAQLSYVYDHDVGVLNFLYDMFYSEPDLLEIAERAAIIDFRDSALMANAEMLSVGENIRDQAWSEAAWLLETIFEAAGVEDVVIQQAAVEDVRLLDNPACWPELYEETGEG
jgi:hypothetical protein